MPINLFKEYPLKNTNRLKTIWEWLKMDYNTLKEQIKAELIKSKAVKLKHTAKEIKAVVFKTATHYNRKHKRY